MKIFNKIIIFIFVTTNLFSQIEMGNIVEPNIFIKPEEALNQEKVYNVGKNLVNAHAESSEDVITADNDSKELSFSKKLQKISKPKIINNFEEEKALLLLRGWDSNNNPKNSGTLAIISQDVINKENNQSMATNTEENKRLNEILAQKNTFDATCYISYTLKFSLIPRKVKLHCVRTDTFKKVKVNVLFTPVNKSFILLGVPYAYEIKGSLYKANTKISEVTNSFNSDFNVATSVNTQAVQEAIDATAAAMGRSIGKNTDRYLTEREASRRKEEIYTTANNSTIIYPTIIPRTTTEKPDWKEYGISAAIGGLGNAISDIASSLKGKYPYLYDIEKGTTLHIKVVPTY